MNTALKRILFNAVAVTDRDDRHDDTAEQQADDCTRTGLWQESGARHDEAAPSDDGSERQRPDIHLFQVLFKAPVMWTSWSLSMLFYDIFLQPPL